MDSSTFVDFNTTTSRPKGRDLLDLLNQIPNRGYLVHGAVGSFLNESFLLNAKDVQQNSITFVESTSGEVSIMIHYFGRVVFAASGSFLGAQAVIDILRVAAESKITIKRVLPLVLLSALGLVSGSPMMTWDDKSEASLEAFVERLEHTMMSGAMVWKGATAGTFIFHNGRKQFCPEVIDAVPNGQITFYEKAAEPRIDYVESAQIGGERANKAPSLVGFIGSGA